MGYYTRSRSVFLRSKLKEPCLIPWVFISRGSHEFSCFLTLVEADLIIPSNLLYLHYQRYSSAVSQIWRSSPTKVIDVHREVRVRRERTHFPFHKVWPKKSSAKKIGKQSVPVEKPLKTLRLLKGYTLQMNASSQENEYGIYKCKAYTVLMHEIQSTFSANSALGQVATW